MLRIFILYCAAVSIQAFSKPSKGTEDLLPLVINTWNYSIANEEAWRILNLVPGGRHQTRNAVVGGINKCEREQCEFNVGYGGTPDELGETTLDAMVMDGSNMNVGAVAGLTDINDAILAARYVLEHTEHSLLVGQGASDFAVAMGLNRSATLATPRTKNIWTKWKAKNCQPNFWTNVTPDAKHSCGPYVPNAVPQIHQRDRSEMNIGLNNHDTISLAAIDVDHQIHSATSTNGLNFKMHGRVGDSPIVGAGNYADNEVGFALSTGDGDIALRFLPTFQAVEQMRLGKTPAEAVKIVMQRIKKYYKKYFGALIAVDRLGNYACECSGWKQFPFIVSSPRQNDRLEIINCSVEIENPEVPLLKAN